MIKFKTGMILASALLAIGGALFFKQLQYQSLNKENSFRARLLRFENLPDGRLVICNLDDQTRLDRIRIKYTTAGWKDVAGFTPLPPSGCGTFSNPSVQSETVTHFAALWAGELESRWNEELSIVNAGHDH